jgi:hypothetical protein
MDARQLNMLIHKYALSLLACVLLVGAESAPCAGQQNTASERSDTSMRSALTRIIASRYHLPVRLDPEPLPWARDAAGGPAAPTSVEMRSSEGPERIAASSDVALRIAGDSVRLHCAGTGLPYAPDSLHKGCPKVTQVIVVIGRPRSGDVAPPDSLSAGRGAQADTGTSITVRVYETTLSRYGRNTMISDYILARTNGTWVFVRWVGLLIIE